jgi:hypothetical protein
MTVPLQSAVRSELDTSEWSTVIMVRSLFYEQVLPK